MKETYYRCPKCGSVITKTKIMYLIERYGFGDGCYCIYNLTNNVVPFHKINKRAFIEGVKSGKEI